MSLIERLVKDVTQNFRTFGGGEATSNNIMSGALKDEPASFAACVDVKEVVRFVLARIRQYGEEED